MGIYYDIKDDIEKYSECWCYIIIGGRNTGKTYSALKYYLNRNEKIVFIKRTNHDIDVICNGTSIHKKLAYESDHSPYKALNRDLGTNIKAYKMENGIGGFYRTTEDGPFGDPIGYIASLNAVSTIKGFDLSDADAIVFDEFIPQSWDRISRNEGEQLMELYKTVSRDRVLRGRGELKLICLANAVNVYNPTCETLELTDIISDMAIKHNEYYHDDYKGILIHQIMTSAEMMAAEMETGIYRAMHDTAWGHMAFGNEFGYNDFSAVNKHALKGYRTVCEILYKKRAWYVYVNEGKYYISKSKSNKAPISYNLNVELQQKKCYYDIVITLYQAAIDGNMYFESYAMYDIIVNFKKRFVI